MMFRLPPIVKVTIPTMSPEPVLEPIAFEHAMLDYWTTFMSNSDFDQKLAVKNHQLAVMKAIQKYLSLQTKESYNELHKG